MLSTLTAQSRFYMKAFTALSTAVFTVIVVNTSAASTPDTKAGPPPKANKPAATTSAPPIKPITGSIRLAYGYKVGDVRRYRAIGFLTGHFPPFATAGSPPIHVMLQLDYVTTVKKMSDKGSDVDFSVENSKLCVLEKEPVDDTKVSTEDALEFPIPLSQVQQMFNAVATIKPTGAITSIQGGDTSKVKLDIGIDLRKLFLLTAPITFADKAVKTGDEWTFDDGLLGIKPGKTTYSGRVQSLLGAGNRIVATVSQRGDSLVDSKLDKEGNSTESASLAVGTLVGKVTLTGTAQLSGTPDVAPAVSGASGRIANAKVTMVVDLRRTLPDPDQPGKQQVTDIDIKARFIVSPGVAAPKPSPVSKGTTPEQKTPLKKVASPKSK